MMRSVSLPDLDPAKVAEAIDWSFPEWAGQCHAVSLRIVKSNVLPDLGYPDRRVARGYCSGVMGQHSWIVLGHDPYDPTTPIVDPTLWSYRDDVDGIYVGPQQRYGHIPHGGRGTIWAYGRPPAPVHKPIPLPADIMARLPHSAQVFLSLCGQMDWHGWSFLANAPVAGWPAAEIVAAMDECYELSGVVPVARLGMLTDRNPGGLYLPNGQCVQAERQRS